MRGAGGGALFHGNRMTRASKTERPSCAGMRTLLWLPVLGVIYALLCRVMLTNGINSVSKEAWENTDTTHAYAYDNTITLMSN